MKQKKSAPDQSGSLFKPMSSGTGLYSDEEEEGGGNLAKILGLAVPIGVGAVYLALQRARSRRDSERAA
jgi:hypothetical protein